MNYDQWKTMSDRDERSDDVTNCCGCDAESRLIEDELVSTCTECGEAYPDMISQFEYDERRREDAAEMYRDDY